MRDRSLCFGWAAQQGEVTREELYKPFLSLPAQWSRPNQAHLSLNVKHQDNRRRQIKMRLENKDSKTLKNQSTLILACEKGGNSQGNLVKTDSTVCPAITPRKEDVKIRKDRKELAIGKQKLFDLLKVDTLHSKVDGKTAFRGNDQRSETIPKQMYGGDEHDEEEKFKKDLVESEKGHKQPILTQQHGRMESSSAAIWALTMEMAEPGEISVAGLSTRVIHVAKALHMTGDVNTDDTEKIKNMTNTILNVMQSQPGKIESSEWNEKGIMGHESQITKHVEIDSCSEYIIDMNDETAKEREVSKREERSLAEVEWDAGTCVKVPDKLVIASEPGQPENNRLTCTVTLQRNDASDCEMEQDKMNKKSEMEPPGKPKQADKSNQEVENFPEKVFQKTCIPNRSSGWTKVKKMRNLSNRCYTCKFPAIVEDDTPRPCKNGGRKQKGCCRFAWEKHKYLDLRNTPGRCRRCSQGQTAGGGGGNSYHNNRGSAGAGGSRAPFKGKPEGRGSGWGQGDENGEEDEDKENRNFTNIPGSSVSPVQSEELMPGGTAPSINHKWFRKKPDEDLGHGKSDGYIPEVLGLLSSGNPNLEACDSELVEALMQVNQCLVQCLLSVQDGRGQEDRSDCLNCTIILSLIRHFVRDVNSTLTDCSTCTQLFELLKVHLLGCCTRPTLDVDCTHTLAICRRIHRQGLAHADTPDTMEKFLWDKLKEIFSRLFNEVDLTTNPPANNPRGKRSTLRRKVSARGTLNIIPEDEDARNAPSTDAHGVSSQSFASGGASSSVSINANANVNPVDGERELSQTDILIRNLPDDPYPLLPRETRERIGSIQTYGTHGCISMPTEHAPRMLGDQLISFEDRPTGDPGIGEVIYGSITWLRNIAEHWTHMKSKCWKGEKFPRMPREEGIILTKYMDKFQIGKTRYQEDAQWQRITPLGRGVSGRCYLARDVNTECQFCVKEILITGYHEDELLIWSNLDHPNIVTLYGAIRSESHIYIMAEFIDGGCLTELINHQRQLNRRLSKAMALRYFKQLLEVLIYLQENNVLHEDLKADNILVRTSSPQAEIVVADFGLARRVQPGERVGKIKPLGSQTQWSPEKAASLGYNFTSDVWAATCVLAHMFNGHPPWVQQYGHAAVLHYVISNNSPPLDDMPRNVTEDIKQLIHLGWTKEPEKRPFAHQLLKAIDLDNHPTGETLFSNVNSIVPLMGSFDQPNRRSGPDDTQTQTSTREQTTHDERELDVRSVNHPESLYGHPSGEAQAGRVPVTVPKATTTTTPAVPTLRVEGSAEVTAEAGEGLWNSSSSDPKGHITQYIQDMGGSAPEPSLLPNLSVFQESCSDEKFDSAVGEASEQEPDDLDLVHSPKPRSASSPNISFYHGEPAGQENFFDSSEMFGSGSPKSKVPGFPGDYQIGHSENPQQSDSNSPTRRFADPNAQHPANPLNLHLDVGRPGVPKPKLLTAMSTPALNLPRGGQSHGPYTAAPTLQKAGADGLSLQKPGAGAEGEPKSPRGSPRSGQASGGSSTRGHDSQSTTPRSSTYDHQDKEMLSLTKDLYEGLLNEGQPNTEGWMELAQSLCSDEQDEEASLRQSLEAYQASLQPHSLTPPESPPGSLIKFVSQSDDHITQVRVKNPTTEWYDIIVEIASPKIHAKDDCKRFFVMHKDGSLVDMNAAVGKSDITVTVVSLGEEESAQTWFIQDHKFHWNQNDVRRQY